MFDTDRKRCQPKANRGDTGWGVFPGAVQNQPGLWMGFIQKIFKGFALHFIHQFVRFFFIRVYLQMPCFSFRLPFCHLLKCCGPNSNVIAATLCGGKSK